MSIDKQIYNARFESPDQAVKLFPTDPVSRLLSNQSIQAIPLLPYPELYDRHIDVPEAVKSSIFRTLTQKISLQLREKQNEICPAHEILRKISGSDPLASGFLGSIARKKVCFQSFLPSFQPEQVSLIYDFLRQITENQRLNRLILEQNLINYKFYHFLTVLELENLALRLPNQHTFLALIKYLESLDFDEFDFSDNFPSENPQLLTHVHQFQSYALPSTSISNLSLYFRNLAISILPSHDLLLDESFLQSPTSLQSIYLHFLHFVPTPQALSQLAFFHQQLISSKKTYFHLLLKLFQIEKFKSLELEVYTQLFEDSYSFVDDKFDYQAFNYFILCAARYVFLLNKNGRKFSFVYDKILKLINSDRQILIDLEQNTAQLDVICKNLTNFSQQEMMIQTQKNRQQKHFFLLVKQWQMKGVGLVDSEVVRQLEQFSYKGANVGQIGYSGLLSRVQQRVDLDSFQQQIDVSGLKKFYFMANRAEGEEEERNVNLFNMLQAMIGTSCLE